MKLSMDEFVIRLLGGEGEMGCQTAWGGGGDGEPDCLGGGGRKLPLFPPTLLVD